MPTDNKTGSNGRFSPDIYFDEAEHIYMVDGKNVPSVTEILAPLHRSYSKINPSVLEYAAKRGTAVHSALEIFDLGNVLEWTPEITPYIQAYLSWGLVYKPKWQYVEKICYNKAQGYAGTIDRVGELNGFKYAVVDIKTSQPTKESLVSVCLQTWAYAIAIDQPNAERVGLFLRNDGTYRHLDCREYEKKYGFSSESVWGELLSTHKTISKLLSRERIK